MEEEDDYMSEKFVTECVKSDVRPGLLYTSKLRHEHEQYKKKQVSSTRPFAELAEERRDEGLKTALPESNKGFALLKKMGYTPGSGVGKQETGQCTPIDIQVKKDSFGLGLANELKEKKQMYKQSTEDYRKTLVKRQELNELKMDYSKIRRICQTLDQKDELKKPLRKWFWPEKETKSSDEEKDSSDESTDSESEDKKTVNKLLPHQELEWRVDCISSYLREKYSYCLWCSIIFDDEKDMTDTCPGRTRKLHTKEKDDSESDSDV